MHEHHLKPSTKHPDYDVCTLCESMFRRDEYNANELYGQGYWNKPNFSTLEEQVYNVSEYLSPEGVTKADAVLKHCGTGTSALEIGCAPGIMLKRLAERFQVVCGIEYDEQYRRQIEDVAGERCHVVCMDFPDSYAVRWIPNETYDCVVGMDILEHANDGKLFMDTVRRILKPGGRAVMMLPALFTDRAFDEKMYCLEHRAIYSQEFLLEWLGPMFTSVAFDRWITGHETCICIK